MQISLAQFELDVKDSHDVRLGHLIRAKTSNTADFYLPIGKQSIVSLFLSALWQVNSKELNLCDDLVMFVED